MNNFEYTDYGWTEDGIKFHNKIMDGFIVAERPDGKCLIYKKSGKGGLLYSHNGTSGDVAEDYIWDETLRESMKDVLSYFDKMKNL